MEAEVFEIGCQKQLLVDNYIVEDAWHAPRKLHHPRKHPANPVLVPDRPCEVNKTFLYGSVAPKPGGGYRMWYTTFGRTPRWGGEEPCHTYRVCYAESEDGIEWRKPVVGLWEWCGSKENNLVLCEDMVTPEGRPMTDHSGTQSFSLLMEPGPAADDGLLHAITKAVPPDAPEPPGGFSLRVKGGICHIVSDDGLRWWPSPEKYLLIAGHSDTPNNIHWNPTLDRYMCFVRPNNFAGAAKRRCAVSLSKDLRQWTQSRIVFFADELDTTDQVYGMGVFPYEGMWLGMLELYDTHIGAIDLQLAHSRDGLRWERLPMRQPILPRGEEGEWDAMGLHTSCHPMVRDNELRLYYDGMNARHGDRENIRNSIGFATWRLDGFLSRRAEAEGQVLTRPFRCEADHLHVNCRAKPGGVLFVEVRKVDEHSDDQLNSTKLAEGYGKDECVPFEDDSVCGEIIWKGEKNLAPFKGQVIRLKFHLSYADLYAFQLRS